MIFDTEHALRRVALVRLRGTLVGALIGTVFGTVVGFVVGFATPAHAEGTAADRVQDAAGASQEELSDTRDELERARSELEALGRRVEALEASRSASDARAAAPATATARLAPVNADNPGISFVVDTALASDTGSSWQSIGYPNGWDFALKNAELFISAPIDPYARGYASINATSDEGFDVEEAAIVTTAIPWGFTFKAGRFFADVGRLPRWHDEALPFVDRPPSIDRLIGGESGSEGVEVAWLTPLDLFVEVTGGVYDTIGAENLEDLNDNGFFGKRSVGELTALGRVKSFLDLSDDWNVEIGATWIGIPKDRQRNLWGGDVTVRHQPGMSTFYQGLVWGSEWLWNRERFDVLDTNGDPIGRTRPTRSGGYSYLETFFARRFSVGTRFDYSEAIDGAVDRARTASAFATWKPSEFQRLRFQFDHSWGNEPTNQRFTLQWTAFIGSHSHGFAQR